MGIVIVQFRKYFKFVCINLSLSLAVIKTDHNKAVRECLKVREYDQETPQAQTTDQPTATFYKIMINVDTIEKVIKYMSGCLVYYE